jgi:hypothetical protein
VLCNILIMFNIVSIVNVELSRIRIYELAAFPDPTLSRLQSFDDLKARITENRAKFERNHYCRLASNKPDTISVRSHV